MKKAIAVFLTIIFIFSIFPMHIFAETTEASVLTDTQDSTSKTDESQNVQTEKILSFSCYLDTETQMVNIKGTVNHDAFTSHRDSVFVIYAVPPGRDAKDVLNDKNIQPLAEASVSITFSFSFKIKNIIDRYSRYAIFMRTPDNKYTLTTQPQFPEAPSSLKAKNDKSAFKGISGTYSSSFSNSNSKKTIIPVYLDSLVSNEATKYVFQNEEKQIFFNASYLENLDSQMQSLNFENTSVYFQFLIRPNSIFDQRPNENAEYILPNTYKYDTITLLHCITAFLSQRYNSDTHGNISGIILGKAWDNAPKYNSFKNISFDDYVILCGLYAMIVSNTARSYNPNIDIALSFNANGFFLEENVSKNSNYQFSAKDIISALMQYFDESSYSGLPCSVFIESDTNPLNLTVEDLKSEIDISKDLPTDKFYIGNQKSLSSFFNSLSQKYKSASQYYNVIWIPEKSIDGQLLSAAYSFAYYSLLLEKNAIGFIVDLSLQEDPYEKTSELLYILKNIDMYSKETVTENVLSFFKGDTWAEVFGVKNIPSLNKNNYYVQNALTQLPDDITGEFSYFNFSNEFLANNWYAGSGCTDIKIDYSSDGIKALHSKFSNVNKDFCDLIYSYEYKENVAYTPYIKMNFEILSEVSSPLYEIKFILQNNKNIFETTAVVKGNKQNEIVLDLSKATELTTLENVKISLRSLDDTVESCTLLLYDITGFSEDKSNEDLKSLIEKEREKTKQEQNKETEIDHRETIIWVVGTIVFTTLLSIVLVMLLRRNGRVKTKE